MTAPPGAPNDRSGDKVATTEEPSTAAFGLLSRAQDLADHLRSDVEAEVAAMRAEASAAHDEARRALIDAPNVHQDAISAQRSAQARLREAQDEAAQLVADAADQATLVADAANLTTESLLASTQVEADEIRGAAMAEDLRLRGLATTELERTREKNAVLLSKAAEIESRQLRASAELRQVDQEATERATSIRAAAEDFLTMAISRAAAEASATHAITVQEIEQARSETAVLRSTAAAEIASARDAAAGEAHRVLCDAADHMNWTQDTVVSLLSTAKAEADRLRHADHQRSSIHLAARRRQLQDVISRVALRVRTAIAEGAAEAERLRAQANAILEAADKDAVATRDHALAHAERVITEADLTVHAALERGQRRLDEAEIGASVLRQRAAETVSGLQREAHEHRRAVRDEATSTLAAARADADTSRAEARDLLTHARADVKVLAARRDDTTAQLGNLSGVIEALAVPGPRESPGTAQHPSPKTQNPIFPSLPTPRQEPDDRFERLFPQRAPRIRPAQVDQHVHQLGAATAAARQEAAERTIEVTKLETAAGQLRSEVERHVQRARTLEEEKLKASAPTFTTLGERVGSILTLADQEANEMRTRAQADAANHHALADESALATRQDADHYSTEMRSAAEAEAARFMENAKRQGGQHPGRRRPRGNGPAGGSRSGVRARTRQGRDCRSGL